MWRWTAEERGQAAKLGQGRERLNQPAQSAMTARNLERGGHLIGQSPIGDCPREHAGVIGTSACRAIFRPSLYPPFTTSLCLDLAHVRQIIPR